MNKSHLKVRDTFFLSAVTTADKAALLEHLRAREIHDNTLTIPYPYTEADADYWIDKQIESTKLLQV